MPMRPDDQLSKRWARIDRRSKARRARRGVCSINAIRCAELNRLYEDRCGEELPDDDAGRDYALYMVHHLAARLGDGRRRIAAWLEDWAPWMPVDEARPLTEVAIAKPLRWRADTLGRCLNLSRDERDRLSIRTIGDIESTSAERRAAREERNGCARKHDVVLKARNHAVNTRSHRPAEPSLG